MQGNTPVTGANIVRQSVDTVNSLELEKLEQAKITARLSLEIEELRLKTAQVMQERILTEYVTQQIRDALIDTPLYTELEAKLRGNLIHTLGEHTINSIYLKAHTLPEKNETRQEPTIKTTAKEIRPQPAEKPKTGEEDAKKETTEQPPEVAPPANNSQAIEAPTETGSTPPAQTGGNTQSQA